MKNYHDLLKLTMEWGVDQHNVRTGNYAAPCLGISCSSIFGMASRR